VNQTSIEQHKLSLYYRTIPSGTTIDEAHTRPARRNAKPAFSLSHSDSSHVIPSPHGLSAAAFARRGLFWWRAQLTEFLFRPRTHLLAPPAPRAHVSAPPRPAPPRTAVQFFVGVGVLLSTEGVYSRDMGRGNSREGGGAEGTLLSTEGVYSRDMGRGNSREGGGGGSSGTSARCRTAAACFVLAA
jgi:hypothetical protein